MRIVASATEGPPRKISEMLPAVIEELLRTQGVALASLESIAVGLGPGSFTGLRIGLATAKGLAYAAQVPLTGISSLAAIAFEGPEGRLLLPCASAGKGQLFVGRYRRAGGTVSADGAEEAMTPVE